jgi:UDP-glucuronate decarboxylase
VTEAGCAPLRSIHSWDVIRRGARLVSNFIMQALRGELITICGDGPQTRSFGFVNDLIEGFLRLMATDDTKLGPINLGSPDQVILGEPAEIIISLTGSRSPVVFKPLPVVDLKQRNCFGAPKLGAEPKSSPKVELREDLKRTIDYFRSTP